MSDQDKKVAREHASRAGRQIKHAANNAAEAAEAAADVVKDEAVEAATTTRDHLKEIGTKLIYSERGRGLVAIGLGLISIGVGVKKFQTASRISENLRESLAQGDV